MPAVNTPQGYHAGEYEVIVVGGGHAGSEAALAAARMGAKTLLLTMNIEAVGLLPCNPSIGGTAKSTLVREIDALGGVMARLADQSQIQIRLLNTGKGPAVQALRAQIDKPAYQAALRRELENTPNLSLRQGEAHSLILENGRVKGVRLLSGALFAASSVVLACGTYLNGRVVIGEHSAASGPAGYPPATALGVFLRDLGLPLARFKTGTPARVDKNSLDFGQMQEQPGERGLAFSFAPDWDAVNARPMLPCWLTYTNEETHRVIRENLHRSPLYSGLIEGVGPRYCPSVEDKVVRFAERSSHQLFLEPEGLELREYYVQGMSSSLPEDVQVAFMRTIPGLQNVVIVRPAYAIEYDCLQPTQLKATLEHKEIGGLFSAGQLNGTSGYEEAAAQGLLAGINAAAGVLGKEPLVLGRAEAFIGVMIDDLITKGMKEPYRLFTSSAEWRLLLRQDNADLRLSEKARAYGLLCDEAWGRFCTKKEAIGGELARLRQTRPAAAVREALRVEAKGDSTLADLLRRPEISYQQVALASPPPQSLEQAVCEQVEIEVKYEGYIAKQKDQAKRFSRLENKLLPLSLDYAAVKGLSYEARQKLAEHRPVSLGQASRLGGVSPADITVLWIYLEQRGRQMG
ncbi:MAG: tRNA uridine-5-carboxymethylaminomethyl(34) synthesis enzyme MnmG [Clostridiales bacterium]|nr:tRNA uridine-5-carboxymethylaminomethyl(34) synthesis enzyme MnmG [Clostridiales bacterium]